jgi:hypothetical protein
MIFAFLSPTTFVILVLPLLVVGVPLYYLIRHMSRPK